MKFLGRLCLLALVCALAAPLFLRTPDGRPLMTVGDWLPDAGGLEARLTEGVRWLEEVAADANARIDAGVPTRGDEAGTRIFRWRDADGVVHFASSAPEGIDAELVTLDADADIVPGPAPQAVSGGAARDARRGPTTEEVRPRLSSMLGDALVDPAELARRAEALRTESEKRGERLRQPGTP